MIKLSKQETRTQNRLHEQLDFFGAKKKRYVSIYANKPRIRVRNKTKAPNSDNLKFIANERYSFACQDPRLGMGLQGMQALGAQNSQSAAMAQRGNLASGMGASGLSAALFGSIF